MKKVKVLFCQTCYWHERLPSVFFSYFIIFFMITVVCFFFFFLFSLFWVYFLSFFSFEWAYREERKRLGFSISDFQRFLLLSDIALRGKPVTSFFSFSDLFLLFSFVSRFLLFLIFLTFLISRSFPVQAFV